MLGIIDYEMGNLGSVENACRFLDVPARVITKPGEMQDCDGVILPGVGAFGDCMRHLQSHGFADAVKEWVSEDKPFLGICLGLQVLFEGSEESPGVDGLGILPGVVRKFRLASSYKVPQMGWNQVHFCKQECPLFKGGESGSYVYFVHSFYAGRTGADWEAGSTDYGIDYTSAVWKGSLFATQFHPEKSHRVGLAMLKNFAEFADSHS
jgi:glutamine amidotransferase